MKTTRRSIEIDAPPEHVWKVMSDVRRWPEWTASIAGVQPLDGELGVGMRARVLQPGLPATVWTVSAWEPNHGFEWVSTAPGSLMVGEHWIEATARGSRATVGIRASGPLGILFAWLLRKTTGRYLDMEAAGLKARSERVQGDG